MPDRIKDRRDRLHRRAEVTGLVIRTRNLDRGTAYRFFDVDEVDLATVDYFSGHGVGTGYGLQEAEAFLDGWAAHYYKMLLKERNEQQ